MTDPVESHASVFIDPSARDQAHASTTEGSDATLQRDATTRTAGLMAWSRRHRHSLYSLSVWVISAMFTLAGFTLELTTDDTQHGPTIFSLANLVVLGVLHLSRRRYPRGVLIVAALALAAELILTRALSVGSLVLAIDLVYLYVVQARSSWLPTFSTLSAVASIVVLFVIVLWGQQLAPIIVLMLMLVLIVGTTVWWGESVRSSRVLAEKETARASAIERLSAAETKQALADTRASIGRDLHDTISGQLSAISMRAEATLADSTLSDSSAANLVAIRASSHAALIEMRHMIEVLRAESGEGDPASLTPGASTDSGIDRTSANTLANVPALVQLALHHGTVVGEQIGVGVNDVPRGISTVGFRVVQEGLANAVKHAPRLPVELNIDLEPAGLSAAPALLITLRNPMPVTTDRLQDTRSPAEGEDGRAERHLAEAPSEQSPHAGGGAGLLGLRERLQLVGGTMSAQHTGDVWTLHARLPLPHETIVDTAAPTSQENSS
ncbi:sensor histidine kinase [Lysinibacter cavernae]|uniref:histidine kinase n=1 Tax=Lysinibacter cavernae TaxID=1640652 RepID=A0A7X5R0E7_9MICO|nr:histidine kinase [Lysinibacter cavernae]NIH53370.1 signal transduction histidine kinase [Lysinibacter cavernae]